MDDAGRNTGLILGAPRMDGFGTDNLFFSLCLFSLASAWRFVWFGLEVVKGGAERVALFCFDIIVGVLPIAFSRILAVFPIPRSREEPTGAGQREDKSLSHFRRRIHRHCLCIEQAGVRGS